MPSPAEALRAAAAVGPYFTWEPWSAGGGWRPIAELAGPRAVAELVEAASRSLGEVEPRVTASVTFLGAAARLVSPPLGALVIGGVLPSARLWWRRADGPGWQIGYDDPAPAGRPLSEELAGLVTPVLAAFRTAYAVSPKVLWGNVTSAVAGATGLLADVGPAYAARANEVATEVLGRPPLAGTGTLVQPDPGCARLFLVRRSCCLYYRVPGGGLCGDCILTPERDRRRRWAGTLRRTPRD